MKALRATCVLGAITFTGMINQVGGNPLGATAPDGNSGPFVSAEAVGGPAASSAVPEASVGPGIALGAEINSVPRAIARPSLMAKVEIGDDSIKAKSVDLGHHDAAGPVQIKGGASDDASNPAPVTQDFQYLIYYVWSELPPAEKPAEIILNSLKDVPLGTPLEEIKRASDAFGLDFNFMKAVARIESGFDPKQRTGSYMGLFQLSKDEFNKFGSGQILDPRDNAVAAAYKIITEGILFG
jgi:soluble lytic murein transglycosylase-like protein